MSDERLRLQPIDDVYLAVSEYERIVEKESLEDELQLAQDTIQELEIKIESLYRNLQQTEMNLAEQERLTEQARSLVVSLEAELALCKEALRQVTA